MAARSTLWYLQRTPLLAALSESQRHALAADATVSEVKRGTPIYRQGDPANYVYFLQAGVVKIETVIARRENILVYLHAGDVFGVMAIVDDGPRNHVARVHEDAVICAISRDRMVALIRQTPELGYRMAKLIGLKLRRLRMRVEDLLCKSAPERVAHTLLDLARDHGVADADGVVIPLRLTQRDLASLVGLTRETINVVFQGLKRDGLVESDRRSIRLRDPERLRAVR